MRTSSTNLIHNYIKNLFAKEDEFLLKIDNKIKKFDLPIHISPEEGKLLYLLCKYDTSTQGSRGRYISWLFDYMDCQSSA